MKEMKRRTFLKKTGISLAGTSLMGTYGTAAFGATLRASALETVNVALIGCRGMGFHILNQHLKMADVRCIALCDVDRKVLDERAAELEKEHNQKPRLYDDFRKLLENKDIDAVIIGTPDHWHCLPFVYACQEGKAVYVEKPMANSIAECDLMVEAANRYGVVAQVGQQQRSGEQWKTVMDKIKSGDLGKLRKVEIWANFNYGVGPEKRPVTTVPEGVDYDFWLGPAPFRSTFNPARFHGSWRMFWDYGGGLITDWGVHLIDMALWAGDINDDPTTILAAGKNLSFENNDHETYDTMSVLWPQKDYLISWEHTAGTQNGYGKKPYGLRFICDLGTLQADRGGYTIFPEWDNEKKADKVEAFEYKEGRENHDLHSRNFIECLKANDPNTHCPPAIGRQVALYAHAANIAVRSGEYKLEWDADKRKFKRARKANAYIEPEYRKPWALPKL